MTNTTTTAHQCVMCGTPLTSCAYCFDGVHTCDECRAKCEGEGTDEDTTTL